MIFACARRFSINWVLAFLAAATALPSIAVTGQSRASHGSGDPGPVTFVFRPMNPARGVFLAGTFNGWNRTATPMLDPDGDGVWTVVVELGKGKHLYKFVVDGVWLPDPENHRTEPDGHGGDNSVLVLGGPDAEALAGSVAVGPYVGPDAETPEWARRVVWYQIFPERFRNGDRRNDPPGTVPWTQDWFKPAQGETGDYYAFIFNRRYGGDVQGIISRLDYLQNLGVSAIYLNPVFESPSLHKYDTEDYRHIDDNFGFAGDRATVKGETADPKTWRWTKTDRLFLKLVEECHKRGMHVILDGVFNHTGATHWAFQDVLKNGRSSPYAGWYKIKDFGPPIDYEGWFGEKSLPEVAQTDNGLNAGFRDHIFAITARWMDPNNDGDPSDGIDGWRLDVANLVPLGFWADWRAHVKRLNPNAYIVGEIWDPSPQFLDGRTFDAQMNYPLAKAMVRFFLDTTKRSTPTEFAREIEGLRLIYPKGVVAVQQNLLGSHDTDRLASMAVNPDRRYDAANRLQDADGRQYDWRKPDHAAYERTKLMVLFQMTYVGAPMVYYGDEVGMWGADDPSDRKPMLWEDLPHNDDPAEQLNGDMLAFYRKVIAIRNSFESLQVGEFQMLATDDDRGIVVFERVLGTERALVILNRGAHSATVKIPADPHDGSYHDVLNDPRWTFRAAKGTNARLCVEYQRPDEFSYAPANATVAVRVSAGWGAILIGQRGASSPSDSENK